MKKTVKIILSFTLASALAGFDACEGPEGPTGPQGLQGVEGTANATLYIFDGHSFNSSPSTERDIELRNESEMFQNVWQVYLVQTTELPGNSATILGV